MRRGFLWIAAWCGCSPAPVPSAVGQRATTSSSSAPTAAPTSVTTAPKRDVFAHRVSCGHDLCCVDVEGELQCWGGGFVIEKNEKRTAFPLPSKLQRFVAPKGRDHACVLLESGPACWGDNDAGQLGDGTTSPREAVVSVGGLGPTREIATGSQHTCALLEGGSVSCWGFNENGQLGDGTHQSRSKPAPVVGVSNATALAVSVESTCVIVADGGVRCWGRNDGGALGQDVGFVSNTPVAVAGLTARVVSLTAGDYFFCARLEDGGVSCWGNNDNGQVGDGTTEDRRSAVVVEALAKENVIALAAGWEHTCALTSDQRVLCWGNNKHGQLGDGTTENHPTPRVLEGVRALDVAAGGFRTCVLEPSDRVRCWGDAFGDWKTHTSAIEIP